MWLRRRKLCADDGRRALPIAAAVAAVTLFGSLGAHALEPTHDYPTRSIRALMGFSAGGITDLLARARAQELSRKLALGRFSPTPHIRADKFKAACSGVHCPVLPVAKFIEVIRLSEQPSTKFPLMNIFQPCVCALTAFGFKRRPFRSDARKWRAN